MTVKTLTTLTAVAALAAGLCVANAQNAPSSGSGTTMKPSASPMDSRSTDRKVTGNRRFCVEQAPGGTLNCKYVSMAACEKDAKAGGLQCSENPISGTTGMKPGSR